MKAFPQSLSIVRIVSVLLLSTTLFSCGKDSPQSAATAAPGTTVTSETAFLTPPFEERLAALEHNGTCKINEIHELKQISVELHALYYKEMGETRELPFALSVQKHRAPYFQRVKAVANACLARAGLSDFANTLIRQSGLQKVSIQDAAASLYLKDAAACEAQHVETMVLALRIQGNELSASAKARLTKSLADCGAGEAAAQNTAYKASSLGRMHSLQAQAAASACSVDSRYFSGESLEQIERDFPAIARPTAAARILPQQLSADLALGFKALLGNCESRNYLEPVLSLSALETELSAFESQVNSCESEGRLADLQKRAAQKEAEDLGMLLSAKLKRLTQEGYQGLRSRLESLRSSCLKQKDQNYGAALLHQARDRWHQFAAVEAFTEARYAEFLALQAEIRSGREADMSLSLSAEGRAQISRGYAELEASMQRWAAHCLRVIQDEKRGADQEQKRQEELKRIEEEKRRLEEEKNRLEEDKKAQEELRRAEETKRRLEEEKRKQDEQRRNEEQKKTEEQKRKEAEQKRIEDAKRAEEQRKLAEEEKRRQDEIKRIEQEKKRLEDEKRRLEESKRAEEQRRKLEEEKRKQDELKRAEEEKRKETERQRLEEEKRRLEEERQRIAEEKRKQAEQKRLDELKRAEEQKRLEQERQRLLEEQRRIAEEKRKEAERQRQETERKRQEEIRRKLEEQKRIAEEKRLKEIERLREIERKKLEEKKRLEDLKRQREEDRKRAEEDQRRRAEELRRFDQAKWREVDEKRARLVAPLWGDGRQAWTNAVVSVIRTRMGQLERARDVNEFCPGYFQAEQHERENCWLMIISGISRRESSFNPAGGFVESSGDASIGLLALSAGECPNAPTNKDLKEAIPNLICGTGKFAYYVSRDRIIDDTEIGSNGQKTRGSLGASAYWSTLSPRHKVYHPGLGRWLTNIGHKDEIVANSRRYKNLRR